MMTLQYVTKHQKLKCKGCVFVLVYFYKIFVFILITPCATCDLFYLEMKIIICSWHIYRGKKSYILWYVTNSITPSQIASYNFYISERCTKPRYKYPHLAKRRKV